MRSPVPSIIVIVIVVIVVLIIAGCGNSGADPDLPTPINTPSATVSEGSTPTPGWITPNGSEAPDQNPPKKEDPQTENPDPTTNPEPTPSPTASEAGTPATQFAARWGKRYPDVPEYAILKAANGTCRLIKSAGNNWNDMPLIMTGIQSAIEAAGLSGNDALEFAQDAEQNYCSSVSNPT